MAIRIEHAPPMAPVASIAYDTGRGQFQQLQTERADRDRMMRNQVQASIYQQQLGLAADAWRQQNALAAERERMVMGAQIAALRDAQNRAYDYYESQYKLQQQKELMQAQLDMQSQAAEREFTLKQQRELAAIDNAVDYVRQEAASGRYSPAQADYLLEQLAAKRAGVEPMPRLPERPALPGDWQPGEIRNVGGKSWYMTPEGKPIDLGSVNDPADAQANLNARTVTYIDPVTGERRGAVMMPNGDLLFPDEEMQQRKLLEQRMELDRRKLDAGAQLPPPKPLTPADLAELEAKARKALEREDLNTGLVVPPTDEQVRAKVNEWIMEAERRRMEAAQAMLKAAGGVEPQPDGIQPADVAAQAEAAALTQYVEEAVRAMQAFARQAGVSLTAEEADRLRRALMEKAITEPPPVPAPPPQPPQQQFPPPMQGAENVIEIDESRLREGDLPSLPPGTLYRLPGDPPGTVRVRGATRLLPK